MSSIITTIDLRSSLPSVDVDSALASQVVSAVNAYVENQTHRCWGELATVTERYDLDKTLWLKHQDVTAIASIKLGWPQHDQQTLDASGYFFNSYGRVTLIWEAMGGVPSNWVSIRNDFLEIEYTYGVEDVPDDLKQAAIGIGAGMYNWAKAGGHEVVRTSVGSYQVQYANGIRSAAGTPEPWNNQAEVYFRTIASFAMQRV